MISGPIAAADPTDQQTEDPAGQEIAAAPIRRLGPLSEVARRGKLDFFLPMLPKTARILDVGCGDNWFAGAAGSRGWKNVTGLDLYPPADIVGNVFNWRDLGLAPHSFDAVVAFEFVEHGDFSDPLHDLLKPDGVLMLTTPIPRADPLLRVLEKLRVLQLRSSPHTHLVDLRHFRRFQIVERRVKAAVSQWAVLSPET